MAFAISQFVKSQLKEHPFPGIDAATIFLAAGESLSAEIQAVIDAAGQSRAFPADGGHLLKIPLPDPTAIHPAFTHEHLGWDHEHCDFCLNSININDICWSVDLPDGGFVLFCRRCFKEVPDKLSN